MHPGWWVTTDDRTAVKAFAGRRAGSGEDGFQLGHREPTRE
jgi:hypothetical protein